MPRKVMIAATALLCFTAGVAAGALKWRRPQLNYTNIRTAYVRTALESAGPADTLILGDSISEGVWLGKDCDLTFNASVGGAKLADVAVLAPFAIRATRPKRIILAVGANDYLHGSAQGFRRGYERFVRTLPAELVLVGVPSRDDGFVQSIAHKVGARYVAPVTGKLTTDGVHPTPRGAREYRRRLAC